MLELSVGSVTVFDERTSKIKTIKGSPLQLEHSLVSISKWESKWHKPFMSEDPKTKEETLDYIKCMTLNDVDESIYKKLTPKDYKAIMDYIEDPMTATTFSKKDEQTSSHEVITSEIIYYWMVASQIPFECQYWHLKRLLTLIRVCGIKNQPEKKMSMKDTRAHYAAINKARRAKYGKH